MIDLLSVALKPAPAHGLSAVLPQALDIPPEWRIAFLVMVGAYALSRPVPFVVRQLSRLVELAAKGLVALCLLGQYLHTRPRVAAGRGPHLVAVQVEDWLEAGFRVVHGMCAAAATVLGRRRRLGAWWMAVAAVALAPAALGLLVSQPAPPRSAIALYRTAAAVWRPVDSLVMTGRPTPVANPVVCVTTPASR